MVPQATRERHEEESKLSYVPTLTRAMTEAEQGAYTIMSDAFRNMFEGRVRDSRIGELVAEPRNFEGATVRYARIAEEDIYSVEATLNRKRCILTLLAGDRSTTMVLTDLKANILEQVNESNGEVRYSRA